MQEPKDRKRMLIKQISLSEDHKVKCLAEVQEDCFEIILEQFVQPGLVIIYQGKSDLGSLCIAFLFLITLAFAQQ